MIEVLAHICAFLMDFQPFFDFFFLENPLQGNLKRVKISQIDF